MAAQASTPKGQVLVNKQFNSPIKMYSAENVAEVLNKQTQVLENGAVGKKEEKTHTHTHVDKDEGMEMGRRERKEGKKKPRKGEGVGYSEEEGSEPADNYAAPATPQAPTAWQPPSPARAPEHAPALARVYSPVAAPAPAPGPGPLYSPAAAPAPRPVYSPVPAPAPAPAPVYSPVAAPVSAPVYSRVAAPAPAPVYSPVAAPARPAAQAPPPSQPAPTPPAPAPQFQGTIPGQPGQPQYPPPLQPYQYPSYQAPPAFEPPPSTVVLRAEAPISQAPFPVFESQPAAVRAAAPKMRGDEKWPPSEYKERAAVENQQRIALARGPAVRPRKVNRDYSKFFAQNALTPNYPSYKAPPGTQHYVEEGTSNF
ncbi:uncharacterized protein GBIM_05820 [Gryllus bimaculatus]|nr:uncharacterized protein GBIM_05820 [Gryllus bimaculatus]